MARGKGRGGYQAPSNPAPVSGPGALSQRTDGGPSQPVRTPTGGDYGSATALREQQQAAPLPQAQSTVGGAAPQRRPVDPNGAVTDPFRPTERPGEPGTAGVPVGPGGSGDRLIVEDPDMLLRVFAERLSRAGFTGAAQSITRYMRRV